MSLAVAYRPEDACRCSFENAPATRAGSLGPQGPEDEMITGSASEPVPHGRTLSRTDRGEPEERRGQGWGESKEPGRRHLDAVHAPAELDGRSFAMDAESPVLVVSGSAGRYQRRWRSTVPADRSGTPDQDAGHAAVSLLQDIRPGRPSLAPCRGGLQWWVRGYAIGRGGRSPDPHDTLRPDPGRAESEAAIFSRCSSARRPPKVAA